MLAFASVADMPTAFFSDTSSESAVDEEAIDWPSEATEGATDGAMDAASLCLCFQAQFVFDLGTGGFGAGALLGFCSNCAIRSRKDPTFFGGEDSSDML